MLEDKIVTLRILIGYLGEKSQANWWPSSFSSVQSEPFLSPIFLKTWMLAKLSGVTEAARRVHDERIGIGRVFHLFRLPETLEQRCFEFLHRCPPIGRAGDLPASAETVLAALRGIATTASLAEEGPMMAGKKSDLDRLEWIPKIAGLYVSAFENTAQSFPYFTEEE